MADSASLSDRCAQLTADLQHAMDNAAPVTLAMMAELKDVLAIGCAVHAECASLLAQIAASDTTLHAAQAKAQELFKEAGDLAAQINQPA